MSEEGPKHDRTINFVQTMDVRKSPKEWIQDIDMAKTPESALYILDKILYRPALKPQDQRADDNADLAFNYEDLVNYTLRKFKELGGNIYDIFKDLERWLAATKDTTMRIIFLKDAIDIACEAEITDENLDDFIFMYSIFAERPGLLSLFASDMLTKMQRKLNAFIEKKKGKISVSIDESKESIDSILDKEK